MSSMKGEVLLTARAPIFTALTNCGPLARPRWSATITMRGKMVHKFLDRADEQSKEAELTRLRMT
jgi:hypothetical protein